MVMVMLQGEALAAMSLQCLNAVLGPAVAPLSRPSKRMLPMQPLSGHALACSSVPAPLQQAGACALDHISAQDSSAIEQA